MSSDPAVAYRRTVGATVLALFVLGVGLTVLLYRQPPKVATAQFDAALAIRRAGVSLMLTPDQDWSGRKSLDVTVTPATRAAASRSGDRVVVTFKDPLRSVTDYHVSVGPVAGRHTGVDGSLQYTFSTPPFPIYTLARSGSYHDGEDDRIIDDTSGGRTLFASPDILEFATAGTMLAVNVATDSSNRVVMVDPSHGRSQAVRLPPHHGPVHDLHAEPDHKFFGFLADQGTSQHLYLGSVNGPTTPRPVVGADNRPLNVAEWGFVPGTTTVVLRDNAGHVALLDAADLVGVLQPLGNYGPLLGFVPGTTSLVLANYSKTGYLLLDLRDGTVHHHPFDAPTTRVGARVQVRAYALGDHRSLDLEAELAADPGQTAYTLVLSDNGERHELLTTDRSVAGDVGVCLGPDGQQAAVAVEPALAPSDDYPVAPGHLDDTVALVNLGNGEVRVLPGTVSQWCSSGPTILPYGS